MTKHKNAFRLSQEDILAYQKGESANSISRKNLVSSSCILRELKRLQIQQHSKAKITLDQSDVEAYQNGEPANSIAKRIGIGNSTIGKLLKEAGITIRKSNQYQQHSKAKITLSQVNIDAYNNGESATSIAKRIGIGSSTIGRLLKEAGITTRKSNQYQNPFKISNEDIYKYQQGESAYSIAQQNSTSASSVTTELKRKKIKIRTLEDLTKN